MSEQELGDLMNAANITSQDCEIGCTEEETASDIVAPMAAAADIDINNDSNRNEPATVNISDCIDIYDFVSSGAALINGWEKVRLFTQNGAEINDTKKVLVGINNNGTPIQFDCNNLYFDKKYAADINEIRVLVSGIIMLSPTADIYVTKNNVFVYVKNSINHGRTTLVKYIKAKKNVVSFVEKHRDESHDIDAEFAKFTIMAVGGRLFNNISDLTDLEDIKKTVLTFMNEKVADINYRIRIEDVCLQLGF